MKIPALRIEINGKPIAVAGAEGLSLLSGQVSLGAGSSGSINLGTIGFIVIGPDVAGPQPRQLTWCDGVQLKSGDKVTFEIVETEAQRHRAIIGEPRAPKSWLLPHWLRSGQKRRFGDDAQPCAQPDGPARGPFIASVGAARRLACNVGRQDSVTYAFDPREQSAIAGAAYST